MMIKDRMAKIPIEIPNAAPFIRPPTLREHLSQRHSVAAERGGASLPIQGWPGSGPASREICENPTTSRPWRKRSIFRA